jgi:hypothetical protein
MKAVEERIRIWTGETLKEITKDIEVDISNLIKSNRDLITIIYSFLLKTDLALIMSFTK